MPSIDEAALLRAVSKALWVWDTLDLEVGETAVVSDGHPESRLIALAATWYGAAEVLFLTDNADNVPAGVTALSGMMGADAAGILSERLRERPGTAAVELSGRAETVDLLLEALPKSSRLLLAGLSREPLTVDYYMNVHRKGLRLVSADLEGETVPASGDAASRMARARRLLARPARLVACQAAVGGPGGFHAR